MEPAEKKPVPYLTLSAFIKIKIHTLKILPFVSQQLNLKHLTFVSVMSQTLYTATQPQTLNFCFCDVSKHFTQQRNFKHLTFVSLMSQTLYTATQPQTLNFCLCDVSKHFTQQLNRKHLTFVSVMSQTLYTATQPQTLNFCPCDVSNTLHSNSNSNT